ncbi:MAG: methyltransferase domain-containing protein [Defluviitaleaceae bacterium]|nr:methyltransferase domain-containing protein [Defluviitaleaceae bacterium]MCL2274402.1 methyltransferase domain-containing protein [Defluviitaleaceae bacterium]
MESKNLLGQFIPLHYHHNMLLDKNRMGGFKTAINQVVQEGATVVELGGGTGVLSFFAAQKAKKVYYVEYNPALVEEARRILAKNNNGDRVELINADATIYTPPEKIDVVICEMLHVALLREKQLEVIDAFKKNYSAAHEGALPLFIPFATLQAVQPVHHPYDFHGYMADIMMFNDPYSEYPELTQLGDPVVYQQFMYDQPFGLRIEWSGEMPVNTTGQVNALRFITKNLLSVEEGTNTITDWSNQYLILPLGRSLDVKAGDVLTIDFAYDSGAPLTDLKPNVAVK